MRRHFHRTESCSELRDSGIRLIKECGEVAGQRVVAQQATNRALAALQSSSDSVQIGKQALQPPVQAYGQCRKRLDCHLRILEKRHHLTLYLGDEFAHGIGRRALGRCRDDRVSPVEGLATAAGEFQVCRPATPNCLRMMACESRRTKPSMALRI